MPQWDVTFTFEADTVEAVSFIVNRIVENHEPVAMTEPQQLSADDEIKLPTEEDL